MSYDDPNQEIQLSEMEEQFIEDLFNGICEREVDRERCAENFLEFPRVFAPDPSEGKNAECFSSVLSNVEIIQAVKNCPGFIE